MHNMSRKRFYQILWALPIIFALHNLEELLHIDKWTKDLIRKNSLEFIRNLYSFQNVLWAMILLTFTVAVVIYFEYRHKNKITFSLTFYSITLLLVNAFTHLIQFFLYQRYVPGLISAVFLFIPTLIYVIFLAVKSSLVSLKGTIIYLVLSLITMGPIIILFLLISKIFS